MPLWSEHVEKVAKKRVLNATLKCESEKSGIEASYRSGFCQSPLNSGINRC